MSTQPENEIQTQGPGTAGGRQCPSCGKVIPAGTAVCPGCSNAARGTAGRNALIILVAALLAVAAFVLILGPWSNRSGNPSTAAGNSTGGAPVGTTEVPARTTGTPAYFPPASAAPGVQTNMSTTTAGRATAVGIAPPESASPAAPGGSLRAGAGSAMAPTSAKADPDALNTGASQIGRVQVYWRFATREYFKEHPKVSPNTVPVPDGYSASLVRVDVENQGGGSVSIDPQYFVLSAEGNTIAPEGGILPGTLTTTSAPAHGSVQGWLLFIKPWWDRGAQKMTSQLDYTALPGVEVALSNRSGTAGKAQTHAARR